MSQDLCRLIDMQIGGRDRYAGKTYNVGGGRDISVSLLELTRQCQALTGSKISDRAGGGNPGRRRAILRNR